MVTINEMEKMLDELALELPEEFYKSLNGGIILLPETKWNERARRGQLCILGQYHRGGPMGKYITIYYGSFRRVFGHLDNDQLKERLGKTLRHEFTHHLEALAGERGLEKKDEKFIQNYLKRNRGRHTK